MLTLMGLARTARRFRACVGAAAVLLALAGCGEGAKYGQVKGVVTFRGEKMCGVRVLFLPSESKGKGAPNPSAYGVTDAEGVYVLQTPADGKAAVRVGSYRVVIDESINNMGVEAGDGSAKSPRRPQPRVPTIYADMIKTPLPLADVKEGEQTFDFELKDIKD